MVVEAQLSARPRFPLALAAWGVMLAVSVLPDALFHELAGAVPAWLVWAKIGLLALAVASTLAAPRLRSLGPFALLLLALLASEKGLAWLTATALWQGWFGGAQAPFALGMLGGQAGRLLVSGIMIAVMLALGLRRADFFLVRGRLTAPIEPVRWLGFPRPDPWTRFGGQWVIYISLGLLAFLVLAGRPTPQALAQVLPLLPVVAVLAALNAFNEELTYRATLLAGLAPAIGPRQALWISALFFGLGHYFGVPYGLVGVLMASFLGWLLGKAMLETRGFAWAWFIHFVQDVLIFAFMAVGSL
jgi:membrane protease YdiL (CAAX protease family)